MLVDSHCHLDRLDLSHFSNGIDGLLSAAQEQDVGHFLCVSINLEDYPAVLKIAESHEQVSASVGLHPNEQGGHDPGIDELVEQAGHSAVVAIGETGLDYFYMNSEKEIQINSFTKQIHLGKKHELPIIIHVRDADQDMLEILSKESLSDTPGVIHCFTGDYDTAKKYLDLGFYISFSGIVTFKRSEELREAAKNIPIDKILIETDSPYLAPVPYRGKPNEPSYVKHVAETVADVRGMSFEEVAQATKANAEKLFRI
ncbi:MAG: TatD family hydrolase [Deltaproteobacteria bacterium]|nr:TatD family hydrolase [Deltaproteobacteria bacterium]